MYSKLIRLAYTCTYFAPMAIVGELWQICSHWNDLNIYWDGKIISGIGNFLQLHYFVLIFLVLLIICDFVLKKAVKTVTHTSIKINMGNIASGKQILSDFNFIISIVSVFASWKMQNFALFLLVISVLVVICFFTGYTTFNVAAWILGYKQYKVATNTDYWLLSKSCIYNFNASYEVVEISNNTLLKI